MPTYAATRELRAPRTDVWAFLAEPTHLSDWWPGIRAVEPDRGGLAPGARWRTLSRGRPSPFVGSKVDVAGMLVVLEVRPTEFVAWQFVDTRLDVELRLTEAAADRTRAELTISAPFFGGLRRSLPHKALTRLYSLCETGACA
jgi:uncharacterized protein YndB with AHSA1/START domain